MAIPKPFITRGIFSTEAYWRRPGAAHAVQILDGVGFGRRIPLERDLDGRVALFVWCRTCKQDVTLLVENFSDFLLNF